MKKLLIILLSILTLSLLFSACNNKKTIEDKKPQEVDNTYPLKVMDKFGNEIILENEPERVISYSPELVEIMYALGVEDTLIGRSIYCDYPDDTKEIPDMGDLFNLNIESIVESNPDLILLSSMASEEIVRTLTEQGLKVLVLDADTNVDGVYEYIDKLGIVFNVQDQAMELTNNMKTDIKQIISKVQGLDQPTAYFVIGFGEFDSAATGDTFIGQLMEQTGATNAAADGSNWMYSIEQLLDKDPDILICSKYFGTKAQISELEGYKELTAVKEGKLYEVDENIFFRQGPRTVEAIKVLAQIFHPEAFK
ncbi:MAG: ABC transporter substrate-binding protein [Firmicutes bacterium HGW-Firmicutes-1]|jgi:iron complex transport system substrate-binding protein|nr:MAG: ABC transporter substrate-binding protein [Firmicutes bacterium HGW-Firmicutes-1]